MRSSSRCAAELRGSGSFQIQLCWSFQLTWRCENTGAVSIGSAAPFSSGGRGTKLEVKCWRHVSDWNKTLQRTDYSTDGHIFVLRFIASLFGTCGCFLESALLLCFFWDLVWFSFILFHSGWDISDGSRWTFCPLEWRSLHEKVKAYLYSK